MSATGRRALVTGVNGFVGPHLVRELTGHGWEVVGVGLEATPPAEVAGLLAGYHGVDLVTTPLPAMEYDAVVHLAGLSSVARSFDEPLRFLTANPAMLVNVCEPFLAAGARPRILVISSGAVYDPDQPMPLAETSATRATSPYVVSKLATEHAAHYYASRGLETVIARPFNHIGPGQGPGFLVPDLIAAAAAAIGSGDPVSVGDLRTRRDCTDVRDVAAAYRLLLEADLDPGTVVNVCSGRAVAGTDVLAAVLAELGHEDHPWEIDPARVRPTDPAVIHGDPTTLERLTGWTREYDVADSVRDAVAAARA